MTPKALIIEPVHPVLLDKLTLLGYEYTLVKELSKTNALEILPQYQGLITSNKLYVDKDLIDAGSALQWIGRMGSGMEIIDVPYAQSKGITCVSSPEGNANAVAEQALGMLLSLLHCVVKSHTELQKNIWLRDENRGSELSYKKVGIIGYGHNGSLFAQKLMAMGCTVYVYDPYKTIEGNQQLIVCHSLDAMYPYIDVLSFHVPLNETTYHYFDHTMLSKINKEFILLNLSRGGIIDLTAVADGMQTGKIKGAAIDVWEQEPITQTTQKDFQLFTQMIQLPNFIGTAHIGGYSHEATYKMSYYVAEKIAQLLDIKE
jgi:D-3-phosphoglycerate dehydrogenase